MPFVVTASRTLGVSARAAFDTLASYDEWHEWMPATFRPAGKKVGRLANGKSFHAKILGLPVAARCWISNFKDGEELTWSGGVKSIFMAEHRFVFVPKGEDQVEVQSIEAWHGVVARLLKFKVEADAKRIGNDQLDALAAAVAKKK